MKLKYILLVFIAPLLLACSGNDDGKVIYAFDIRDEYIYIPFYYAVNTLKLPKRERQEFRQMKIKFRV